MARGPLIKTAKTSLALSRRTFLRGAIGGCAVALALPSLEAMLDSNGTAFADGTELPKRYVLWFWGNGVVTNRWTPEGTGAGYTLSEELQAFAKVKDYLTVVSGTAIPNDGASHSWGPAILLTGQEADGNDRFGGGTAQRRTFDQIIAEHIGGDTPVKSVQTGITYYSHDGPSSIMMYDNTSFAQAGTPLKAQTEPADVAARLFGDAFVPPMRDPSATPAQPSPRDIARGRALDVVLGDANRLMARLGQRDKERLDAHLTALRDLQKRLRPTQRPVGAECKAPDLGAFGSYSEKANVMNEVLRLGFACDRTRVATYQFSSPASHREYPEIGINTAFHANVCHQESPPQETYDRGVKYFMARFASFLEAMKNTPEGGGNMLDNMCVLGTSCIGTQTAGGAHDSSEWPIVVAGKLGGRLKSGIHYRSPGEHASKVPLTIMKAFGVPMNDWGVGASRVDSTVPILT